VPRPLKIRDKSEYPRDEHEQYDQVMDAIAKKRAGAPGDGSGATVYWGPLSWWPAYALTRLEQSSQIRTAGDRDNSYTHIDREWADQVLAVVLRTNVVQNAHLPDALAVGVRLEAIEALRAGRDDELTPHERLLATFIREIVNGTVTDETWNAVEADIGERATLEYLVLVTMLWLTFRQMNALGIGEPTDADIGRMLDEFKSGSRQPPGDWRRRNQWAAQTGSGNA
jgi:hypothetical protein